MTEKYMRVLLKAKDEVVDYIQMFYNVDDIFIQDYGISSFDMSIYFHPVGHMFYTYSVIYSFKENVSEFAGMAKEIVSRTGGHYGQNI